MDKLESIKKEAILAIKQAPHEGVLLDLEKAYLGKTGKLILFFKELKNLSPEERKELGGKANEFKAEIQKEIDAKRAELGPRAQNASRGKWIDVTVPGKKFESGHLHPISKITNEMCGIFESMGFEIVNGPDVETEYYNFDALNIPKNHPARDMWDTFWLKEKDLLLRTHTSPMQIRYMEKNDPPLRIVVPGRCYRYEATDATHDIQFNQLEGLMIGNNINLSHLKGVLQVFFRNFFSAKGSSRSGEEGKKIEIRFRPSYFPFVEPGVEVDMKLGGKWLEIAGAGMVHPQVIKNVKLDPQKWQGFAFGIGIDRMAILKYKIDDIRWFYSGDLRFIKQF